VPHPPPTVWEYHMVGLVVYGMVSLSCHPHYLLYTCMEEVCSVVGTLVSTLKPPRTLVPPPLPTVYMHGSSMQCSRYSCCHTHHPALSCHPHYLLYTCMEEVCSVVGTLVATLKPPRTLVPPPLPTVYMHGSSMQCSRYSCCHTHHPLYP